METDQNIEEGLPYVTVAALDPAQALRRNFAFPSEYLFDNLRALLGMIQNPWETNTERVGSQKMDLCVFSVTIDMCAAYVQYRRRIGEMRPHQEDLVEQFFIRTAAPEEMVREFDQKRMIRKISKGVVPEILAWFDAPDYGESKDSIHFHDSWVGPENLPRPEQQHLVRRVCGGNAAACLYATKPQIDELRARIREKVWNHFLIEEWLSKGYPKEPILDCMRQLSLPWYNVPLLRDSDEV